MLGKCYDKKKHADFCSLRSRQERIKQAESQGKTADEVTAIANDTTELEQAAGLGRAQVRMMREFDESIDSGFQIATFQGPLCAEPVVGMAWIVEEISIKEEEGDEQG
jgi:ribosome assembly protein 1